jgi:hypothetical protein
VIVKLLHQSAKEGRSFDVRKYLVYGLEDIDLPSVGDALSDDPRALQALIKIIKKKDRYC